MFTLKISLTLADLDAIKADLIRALPEVKSSHRCEALARGCGFRTYAALLAACRSSKPVVTIDGARFSDYLALHGFDVHPPAVYRAASRVAIRAAVEATPALTMWGIGVGQPRRKSDGEWQSGRDMQKKFAVERKELLSDLATEPFLLSLAFLSRVTPTKTVRQGTGSYWLKHIAERYSCTYPEGDELGPQYVANGALIAAAVHLGFRFKTHLDDLGYYLPNVTFNISKLSLIDLDCEIRPDGAYAQDRRRLAESRKASLNLYAKSILQSH